MSLFFFCVERSSFEVSKSFETDLADSRVLELIRKEPSSGLEVAGEIVKGFHMINVRVMEYVLRLSR